MRRLFLATILFLFPFSANAGFPEGENGYDLKKIEESFRLPCDEIGNDDCIARALGVGAIVCVMHLQISAFKTEKWTRKRTSTSELFLCAIVVISLIPSFPASALVGT